MKIKFMVLLMLVLSYCPAAYSSTLYVGSGQTYSTISSAHAAAVSGDTIMLMNDITEYNIGITKSVTVEGDAGARRMINGNTQGRIFLISSAGTVTLRNLNITGGNLSDGRGGGIYVDGGTTLYIDDCIVQNCNGYGFNGGGGGMNVTGASQIIVTSSTFYNNRTWNSGGNIAVVSSDCSLTMTDTEVSNGFVNDYSGGGIYADGTLDLTRCYIYNNSSNRGGGGLQTTGTVTLQDCTVKENHSYYDMYGGGGIRSTSGTLTATGCTISGNVSYNNGGGLLVESSTYYLNNCTVYGNNASNQGGGISVSSSSLNVNGSTITANVSYQSGGVGNYQSTMSFKNTIIGNNNGYNYYPDLNNSSSYPTMTLINCIITSTQGVTNWTGSGNIFNTDPKLTALALNDNPNGTYTCALQTDSPAFNNGTSDGATATDQRGFPRFGVPDIGAYEFTPVPAAVTTQDVTDITGTTATGNGNITGLGLPDPTQHGVCWNTGGNPSLSDNYSDEGAASATGAFTSGITGLIPFIKYYVKAYATNMAGTVYGNEVNFVASGTYQAQTDAVNCLNFNGTSQYLESDIVTAVTDNMTVEAWVNWDGQASGRQSIIYNGNTGSSGYGIYLYDGATPPRSISILCGGKGWVTSSTELPAGSWHHLAAVRSAGVWKLYMDGVERALSNTSVVPNVPVGKFDIAAGTGGGGDRFKGKVDEVRIWTTARTKDQIQASYGSLAGNDAGLTAYWRMDEGSGTYTVDGSGHGNTLTLYGSPSWIIPSTAPVSAPVYQTSDANIDFGKVDIYSSSDKTYTITNAGGGFLHISEISSDNSTFSVLPATADIASGADIQFTVTFAPVTGLDQTGTLTLTHNPDAAAHNITVSGKVFDGAGTSEDPYQITSLTDLRALSETSGLWNKYFIQTADINASATSGWNSGSGFSPVGINATYSFTGNYDGQGYLIDSLFINRGGTTYIGLFGRTASPAVVKNLIVSNANITGNTAVGVIVGENRIATISDCGCSGTVIGNNTLIGGLAGWNNGGTVSGCYSNSAVSGVNNAGGLVGSSNTQISDSYSFGSVTRASGSAGTSIGAFAGTSTGSVIRCYSTGNVYYADAADPTDKGFIGSSGGTVSGNFFDSELSNQDSGAGATAKTSAEMKTRPTFTDAGWDFLGETANGTGEIWNIGNGRNGNYPYLSWQFPSDAAPELSVLSTTAAADITSYTASSGGNITDSGNGEVVQRGVCWNISGSPDLNGDFTSDGTGTGEFVSALSGLDPYTEYYIRAYAVNSIGISYGNEVSFTTLGLLPVVTTQAVSDIKGTTATGNGTVNDLGIPDPSQYGVCWNTAGDPTTADFSTDEGSVSVTGPFTTAMTGLSCSTTYYVKAYASNAAGTTYGEQVSFTTAQMAGSGTSEDPYLIANLNDLQTVSENNVYWDKYLVQTADIDASATSGWNSGAGFSPVGNVFNKFTGQYDGQGYKIEGLYINRAASDYQGMFGQADGSVIENLNLKSVNVTGKGYAAAVAGYNTGGSVIRNCSVTGIVSGFNNNVGGIAGCNESSAIEKCFGGSDVNMTGNYYSCGGVVGWNYTGTVNDCYATGIVTGVNGTGGLVGNNDNGAQINRSFSSGVVSGTGSYIGGLTGLQFTGSTNTSFWDKETSGQTSSASGTGKTTAEMKILSTFTGAGWDFTNVWNMDEFNNSGYPFLRWQVFPVYSPQNITIAYVTANPELTWTAVTGAASYKVYSSSDPYSVFPSGWTEEAVGITELTWTDTIPAEKRKFYIVVAVE